MFHSSSRIHYDENDITESDHFNNRSLHYTLHDFKLSKNTVDDFALQQPNINYFGSSNISQNIDYNSSLLLNKEQNSIHHERSSIKEPIFYSRPYLGKGNCNVTVETTLRNGECYHDKNFVSRLKEKSTNIKDTPLLPNVKRSLAKPINFVETSDKWVRGGMPTRE